MLSKSDIDTIIQFPIGDFYARNPKELQFAIETLVTNYLNKRLHGIETGLIPQDQHAIYAKVIGVLDTVKHKIHEKKVMPFERQHDFEEGR